MAEKSNKPKIVGTDLESLLRRHLEAASPDDNVHPALVGAKPLLDPITVRFPWGEVEGDLNKPEERDYIDRLLSTSYAEHLKAVLRPPSPIDTPCEPQHPADKKIIRADTSIERAIELYINDAKVNWARSTANDWPRFLDFFLEVLCPQTGTDEQGRAMRPYKAISSVRTADFLRFQEMVRMMPPNRTKRRDSRGKTILELYTLQDTIPAAKRKTVGPKTVDNYGDCVNAFLSWCVHKQVLAAHPGAGQRLIKRKAGKARQAAYRSFTAEELQAIFHVGHYKCLLRPHEFWAPLIALYTGSRLGQIMQLYLRDLWCSSNTGGDDDLGDIWLFDFTLQGAEDKTAKNIYSARIVPVHPELVRIGLLDYANDLKAMGHDRLFPYILRSESTGKWSKEASRDFAAYLGSVGVHGDDKVFHSFRYNARSVLDRQGVRENDIDRMVGHEDGRPARDYTDTYGARMLYKNTIPRFIYNDLDLSHLKYTSEQYNELIQRTLDAQTKRLQRKKQQRATEQRKPAPDHS